MTSYELQYGKQYKGTVCAFGESVLYKAQSPNKGDVVFKRVVQVGKSTWSDCHVILTPSGAVEARSVRRLPEQFNSLKHGGKNEEMLSQCMMPLRKRC